MSPDSIAEEKARLRLAQLKTAESTIIDEIIVRSQGIGKRIVELAQILEQRMELLDPELKDFAMTDISKLIAQSLRDKGCPIAPWVRDYLPPKYKNPNLIRADQIIQKIHEIGAELPRHLPEECSSFELQELYDKTGEIKNVYDSGTTYINKVRERIEYVALQNGYQLNGEKFRRQISHTDFNEPNIPTTLQQFREENRDLFFDIGNTWHSLGEKYYNDPPMEMEEIIDDNSKLKTFRIVLQPWDDYKATGDILHAFERQYISDLSGKHAAGNSDKFPTKLCVNCSEIDDKNPDPDTFEIMVYDTTSESHYRCMKCAGTKSITRGMSREQVGDSQAVMMRKAGNIIRHMPLLGQSLHRWSKKYIQVKEDSRKVVIAPFFSDSAISQQGFKVAKSISD